MTPRVIPCLLLKNGGLVKGQKFKNDKYIGDPLNAVRVFNEKAVDELVFLDVTASTENREPNYGFLRDIASECFMPLAYGGGIATFEQASKVFDAGIEKVVINAAAYTNPSLITEIAKTYGTQAVVVSIDVRSTLFGKRRCASHRGTRDHNIDPVAHAKQAATAGAGEILLNSIDRDGTMTGYDLPLVAAVSQALDIPVIAAGGSANMEHFREALRNGASAVAAGSQFVFQGKHRAVLITYPHPAALSELMA